MRGSRWKRSGDAMVAEDGLGRRFSIDGGLAEDQAMLRSPQQSVHSAAGQDRPRLLGELESSPLSATGAYGRVPSVRSHDSASFYDSRSDGASAHGRSSNKKKKKRFPLGAGLKKSIIMTRNRHQHEIHLRPPYSSQSLPEEDSLSTSPRNSVLGLKPSNRVQLVPPGGKKKRVSTMQTLKNKVLPRKSRRRRRGKDSAKNGLAAFHEDDSDYQETMNSEEDEEDDDDDDDDDDDEEEEDDDDEDQEDQDDDDDDDAGQFDDDEEGVEAGVEAGQERHSRRSGQHGRSSKMVGEAGKKNKKSTQRRQRRSSVDEQRHLGRPPSVHRMSVGHQNGGAAKTSMIEPGSASGPSSPAGSSGKESEMQDFLMRKLAEWQVPQAAWKLPNTTEGGSEAGVEGGSRSTGASGLPETADARRNAKLIKQLEAAFREDEKRTLALKAQVDSLRSTTQYHLDDLKQQIGEMEARMDSFEHVVQDKEKQIKDTYQNYKSSMITEIRENVRNELDRREQDYYSLISRVEEQLKTLSSAGPGVLDGVLHRTFSLTISGAGTIAHVVSMGVGFVLRPVSAALSLLRPAPRQ